MPEFTIEQVNERIKTDPGMKKLATDDPTEFESQVNNLYRHFGYRPDGSELPLVQRGIQKVAKTTGVAEPLVGAVAALPIPLITTAAGAIGGTAVTKHPAGGMAGAMVGSLYGEEMNVAAGITDPMTLDEKALALGAPLLGPLASRGVKAARNLLQRLPGSQFGVHELAGDVFQEGLKKIRVSESLVTTSRQLMQTLPDVKLPMPGLQALIKGESKAAGLAKEFPGSKQYMDALSSLEEEMAKGPMSMKKIMAWERAANLEKSAGSGEVWGKMAGTIIDDLESAMMNPKLSAATRDKVGETVKSFKMYIGLKNKFNADEALDALYNRVVKPVADDTSLISFNKKAFIEGMRADKKLNAFWSSSEKQAMIDAVEDIGYIAKGVESRWQKYSTAGAGLGIGMAVAPNIGIPGQGAMAGILIANASIREALSSDPGRKALKWVAQKGAGKVDLGELQTILQQITAGVGTGGAAALKGARDNPVNPFGNQE